VAAVGLSAADVQVLQSSIANQALVAQLVAILQNPTSAQRPDLLHFAPAARLVLRLPARRRDVILLAAVLAVPVLWLAALPLLRLRARPVALLAIAAPALAAGLLVLPALVPRPVAAVRQAAHPTAAPAAWTKLVGIESRLNGDHRSLLAVEGRLVRLTADLATSDQPGERVQPHVFAALAAVHEQEEAAYQRDLEQEYELYQTAAQQPAVSAQLQQGAASAGSAAAERAVDSNLQTLATQLQQEAVISQAQARLQQLGFTAEQAKALRSHHGFIAPLGGPITQPFGPTSFALEPPLVYDGVFYPHFHTGLDIEAPIGAPVMAAADGVVALVATSTDGHGHTTGYGTYIMIAHARGYYTLYAHLSKALVSAGQLVHQGQVVGLVGVTGNSTGPHLHFEIRLNGRFLDPLPYVTGRLQPW
jgi:murein DD-endopeptidase MepM/ murein hydrolase activator NlpD